MENISSNVAVELFLLKFHKLVGYNVASCHFFLLRCKARPAKKCFVFVVHKYQRSIFCDVFSSICGVNVAIVLSEQSSPTSCAKFRGVVPGGARGAMAPAILADKLTLP